MRFLVLITFVLSTFLVVSCRQDNGTVPAPTEPTQPSPPTSQPTPAPTPPPAPTGFDKRLQDAKAYAASRGGFRSDYMALIDFSVHSSKVRFFIVNLQTGQVSSYHTAHGKGSDPEHTGYATSFSNVSGSNKTSLGYYKAAETYQGEHGYSLRLDGLSASNSNARSRAIVIHPADYVYESNTKAGRSWGCPALAPSVSKGIIDKLKNGALIYAY